MYRDTNPFQDGMIEQIFYCNGRTYKTFKGALKNNPKSRVYLVKLTYEELMCLIPPEETNE